MDADKKKHFLFPGTLFASDIPFEVSTILGSCVALCLWDRRLKSGGINHYLLPLWNGRGLRSPKYGNIAIKKLIEKMMMIGSDKGDLQAKIFGGASVLGNRNDSTHSIGQQNIIIVKDLLEEYRIPIISSHVGGTTGRKVHYYTDTGTVLMKMITKSKR